MTHPTPPQRSRLLWFACDLDNTLFRPLWTPDNPTSEIGEPIWENVRKYNSLVAAGYKGIIHTSRPDADYEAIEMALDHYQIRYKAIRTGKPLAAAYIDDRGMHAGEPDWLTALEKINGQPH